MKNFLGFVFLFSISILSQDINKCTIRFSEYSDSLSVVVNSRAKIVTWPRFTPGNHCPDSSLSFTLGRNDPVSSFWVAILAKRKRGQSSGRVSATASIYHISSGPLSPDLSLPLQLELEVPATKDLVFHGRIFSGEGQAPSSSRIITEKFSDYFIAREFPVILLDTGKYFVRYSRLNRLDSIKVVYSWVDKLGQAKLSEAFAAFDSAASQIGQLAPNFWHRYIQNFAGAEFTLVYIISPDLITGLESCSAPYLITTPQFISEELPYHVLLHTLIGKFCAPAEYRADDGHYHPSDLLGFYEGLTTFLSLRFSSGDLTAFANKLAGNLYRAKLAPDYVDLRELAYDQKWESWYAKGYLFWLSLQAAGLDVPAFVSWIFENELINSGRTFIQFSDILNWLKKFNPAVYELAAKNYQGDYLAAAWQILATAGWSPAPLKESPRWYKYYLGPYPITPGVQLPTDDYPVLAGYPKYLITPDGSKLVIEATDDDEALQLFKSQPDQLFLVEFSSGEKLKLKDNFCFSDGTPYFMFGRLKTDLSQEQKVFWRKLDHFTK